MAYSKPFLADALHNAGTFHKQCRGTLTLNPGSSFTGNPIESDPCIAINDVSLNEGNSGTKNFIFQVSRSGGTTGTTTLHYATPPRTFPPFPTSPGTAIPGDDYVSRSGTLTFTPGQTIMTISIAVKGDTIVEPNEEFIVRLSNCSSTGCIIIDGKGVGTIRNDDS